MTSGHTHYECDNELCNEEGVYVDGPNVYCAECIHEHVYDEFDPDPAGHAWSDRPPLNLIHVSQVKLWGKV
jgi:hypothetical protein